jgi:gas vesicle protein
MEQKKSLIERIHLYILLLLIATFGLILSIPVLIGVDFGDYGSFIGGLLGTLIGGVTVYLVYETYSLQKRELQLSRDELKLTRNELELTRSQIVIQNFETTFFNLIEMFSKIREEVKNSNGNSNDAFQDATTQMKLLYKGSPSAYQELDDIIFGWAVNMQILLKGNFESELAKYHFRKDLGPQGVLAIFNKFKDIPEFEQKLVDWIITYIEGVFFQKRLTNYYTSIESIVHYIHNSFPSSNKTVSPNTEKYFNIFYSTLSAFEKAILFYHIHNPMKKYDNVVLRKLYLDANLNFGIDAGLLISEQHLGDYSLKLYLDFDTFNETNV